MKRLYSLLRRLLREHRRDFVSERAVRGLLERDSIVLAQVLEREGVPRVAFVKQDICEDLYCCKRDAQASEIISSTQLRSGPVALFSRLNAKFIMLETTSDPECSVWKERATDLKWAPLEFFSSYRDLVPGCDYGQSAFAVSPDQIEWSDFDLVISVDVSVPERVTRRFPKTAWAYYIREIKAPSYCHGLDALAPGQDFFLNHGFRWKQIEGKKPHVVEFPYHLQYFGCFHELFDVPINQHRSGVFVDFHLCGSLSEHDRRRLETFGPLTIPERIAAEPGQNLPPRRTMDPDLRNMLLGSKYFLYTPGRRTVFGTGMIEAIAAGCLVIGSPEWMGANGYFFAKTSAATNVEEAVARIRSFEANPRSYQQEVNRQRLLVDYLCYTRPLLELLSKMKQLREGKPH